MSQGQAYMPIHSSPAQNQTTQSHLEKFKVTWKNWKLHQHTKFKKEFGLWESHMNWNQQMLQCPTFSNRVLRTLKFHTKQSEHLLHTSTKGCIDAMIHLRTNKFFVIATHKNLRASFKQHWYSAHLRNTRFHRILSKGKLGDVMIWPLEKVGTSDIHHLAERKRFWIKTLQISKIWVKKSSSGNTPTVSEQPTISEQTKSPIQQQTSLQSDCIHTTGSPTVNTMSIRSQLCLEPNKTVSPESFSPFSHASLVHFLREQYSRSDSKATKEQRDFLSHFTLTYGKSPPKISAQTPALNSTADQSDILSKNYNQHRPETPIQTCQETIPSIAPSVKQLQRQNEKRKLSQDIFQGKSNK